MSGEWLTLGRKEHKCVKPTALAVGLAGARPGALWRCSECGLIWELGEDPVSLEDTWNEYQELSSGEEPWGP